MGSTQLIKRLEKLKITEDNIKLFKDCSICNELMIEPVCLKRCGHRICINCLNNLFLKDKKRTCPICFVAHEGMYNQRLNASHIDTKF